MPAANQRLPAIFFGHGNPMNALGNNAYTSAWPALGKRLPRPRAVLCISAHWYLPQLAVTAMAQPLLYVLGAADPDDAIAFPVEGMDGGSVSMLSIQIG